MRTQGGVGVTALPSPFFHCSPPHKASTLLMSTANPSSTRKKVIHSFDPLDDWPEQVYSEPGHVRYIVRGEDTPTHAGYWADWTVQTTNLKKLSDHMDERAGKGFCTIAAVIFYDDTTALLVTDPSGYRYEVSMESVRVEGVKTTR